MAVAAVSMMYVLGCDAGDDGCKVTAANGQQYDCDSEAPTKCQQVVTDYCDAVAACSWLMSAEACKAAALLTLDCNSAVAVTNSYWTCLVDIDGASCSEIEDDLPLSCKGAILASSSNSGTWKPDDDPVKDPPDDEADTFTFQVSSLAFTVSGSKSNGDAWDAFGGAPDPTVELYVDDSWIGTFGVASDTFDPYWDSGYSFAMTESSVVEFSIWDQDISEHDFICTVTLNSSDIADMILYNQVDKAQPCDTVSDFAVSVY